MAKSDDTPQVTPVPTPLPISPEAFAAGVVAAIDRLGLRTPVPLVDQKAIDAAAEYGKIKGALRTHSERIPKKPSASFTSIG